MFYRKLIPTFLNKKNENKLYTINIIYIIDNRNDGQNNNPYYANL